MLAYVEEGLWDLTVWKEHVNLFKIFHFFGHPLSSPWLIFVVPLLATGDTLYHRWIYLAPAA